MFEKAKVEKQAVSILMETNPEISETVARDFIRGVMRHNPQCQRFVDQLIRLGKRMHLTEDETAMSILAMIDNMFVPLNRDELTAQDRSVVAAINSVALEWNSAGEQLRME